MIVAKSQILPFSLSQTPFFFYQDPNLCFLCIAPSSLTAPSVSLGAELFWYRDRTCWISTAGDVNVAKFVIPGSWAPESFMSDSHLIHVSDVTDRSVIVQFPCIL